ncbi:MAG: metal-dependent hydrolase [Bryobacterales bacterium]|nr:metal-dependent hydrolase [Bryobacterales bacterium]
MNIVWLGHSTFLFEIDSKQNVLIDPWIEGNPRAPQGYSLPAVHSILLSHGHGDHTGDAISISRKNGCKVVCNYEISLWLEKKGVETCSPMNKGGMQTVGDLEVTMTHAFHSSSMQDGDAVVYGGEPAGYIIRIPDGRRIYFAGDTAVFGDMRLIARLYEPDLAILPIGDLYTMGPKEAAVAVEFLGVKKVIPMHYGTFPPLTGTPAALRALVGADVEVIELEPGTPYAY